MSKFGCLAQITDFILRDMGEERDTGMILIGPQNVFDTLDYKILLDKMTWFQSIRNKLVWVSFIKKKIHYIVSVDNIFLEAEIVNRKVLQRPIL